MIPNVADFPRVYFAALAVGARIVPVSLLLTPEEIGYVLTDSGADLIAGAKLFAGSADGLIPWRGRPESLKRGLVARFPPLDLLKDIA